MMPWSLTPLTRKTVTGVLFLRTWFRNTSCTFCDFSVATARSFLLSLLLFLWAVGLAGGWSHGVSATFGAAGGRGTTTGQRHSSSTRLPNCKRTQPCRQRMSGRKMEIGGCVVNAPVVRGIADQHRGD